MNLELTVQLIRREIAGRYRGSTLGMLWSVLMPILMLSVYTFVFGIVLRSRWSVGQSGTVEHSTAEFAIILFSGLLMFQFFSDVVGASSEVITNNRNYVKKVVFPVEVLPVVTLGTALFHAGVNLVVLTVATWWVFDLTFASLFLMPLALAPLAIMALGFAWTLAAIGVYFRDVGQVVPPLLTATMFLSPIFFPRTALPIWVQSYLSLNPLTVPVEALRDLAVFGAQPNWKSLGLYSLVAVAVAVCGRKIFDLLRRGFADVL